MSKGYRGVIRALRLQAEARGEWAPPDVLECEWCGGLLDVDGRCDDRCDLDEEEEDEP